MGHKVWRGWGWAVARGANLSVTKGGASPSPAQAPSAGGPPTRLAQRQSPPEPQRPNPPVALPSSCRQAPKAAPPPPPRPAPTSAPAPAASPDETAIKERLAGFAATPPAPAPCAPVRPRCHLPCRQWARDGAPDVATTKPLGGGGAGVVCIRTAGRTHKPGMGGVRAPGAARPASSRVGGTSPADPPRPTPTPHHRPPPGVHTPAMPAPASI